MARRRNNMTHSYCHESHHFYREGLSNLRDRARKIAPDVFAGVTGLGRGGDYAVAVADTTPTQLSVLLSLDDIAAAYATLRLTQAYERSWPKTRHECRQVAHQAWADFVAEIEAEREHNDAHGGPPSIPTVIAYKATKINRAEVARITQLAGRMERALRGMQAERSRGVPEEVSGIELGDALERLLPLDAAAFSDVDLQDDALERLVNRRLQQFEMIGTDTKARGPLVVALDESGSMSGPRNRVAKAAMTALVKIAWDDRRPVRVVHFAGATRVTRIEPGREGHLIVAQSSFLDGTTEIGTALAVATREVKDMADDGITGADVVIISDGGDTVERSTFQPLVDAGSRLFALAIGAEFKGPLREAAAAYAFLPAADDQSTEAAEAMAGAVL